MFMSSRCYTVVTFGEENPQMSGWLLLELFTAGRGKKAIWDRLPALNGEKDNCWVANFC